MRGEREKNNINIRTKKSKERTLILYLYRMHSNKASYFAIYTAWMNRKREFWKNVFIQSLFSSTRFYIKKKTNTPELVGNYHSTCVRQMNFFFNLRRCQKLDRIMLQIIIIIINRHQTCWLAWGRSRKRKLQINNTRSMRWCRVISSLNFSYNPNFFLDLFIMLKRNL